jgi:hypothetical protein
MQAGQGSVHSGQAVRDGIGKGDLEKRPSRRSCAEHYKQRLCTKTRNWADGNGVREAQRRWSIWQQPEGQPRCGENKPGADHGRPPATPERPPWLPRPRLPVTTHHPPQQRPGELWLCKACHASSVLRARSAVVHPVLCYRLPPVSGLGVLLTALWHSHILHARPPEPEEWTTGSEYLRGAKLQNE